MQNLKHSIQAKFIPFYASLGLAFQEIPLNPLELFLADTHGLPTLHDSQVLYEESLQKHKIHVFSAREREATFIFESDYKKILFDYSPVFNKNLTEDELYGYFIEYYTQHDSSGILWFIYQNPITGENNLFITYVI